MFRRLMPLVLFAALAGGASSALAAGETVVAYGTGQVAVTPTNPKDDASIKAAVTDAQLKATPAAVADAKVQAQAIADAASLTLGPIFSVAQQNNVVFYGSFGGSRVAGPFNGNFCGTSPARLPNASRSTARSRPRWSGGSRSASASRRRLS